jgi:hydrogenase-1 operon protein HyaE
MTETHPLIHRLTADPGSTPLDPDNLDAFCEAPGDRVIFCGGDPARYPECLDLAVILPELCRAFPGRFRVGVAGESLEPTLKARFGIARWPSLVFLRDGGYVGTIAGLQDWGVYLARMAGLLKTPAGRAPSLGVPIAAPAAHPCH